MLGWLHKRLDHQQKILLNYVVFVTGAHLYLILCVLGFSCQKIIKIVVPPGAQTHVRYIPTIVRPTKRATQATPSRPAKKRAKKVKKVKPVTKKRSAAPPVHKPVPEPVPGPEPVFEPEAEPVVGVAHDEFDQLETMREITCALQAVWTAPVGVTIKQPCELLIEVDAQGKSTHVELVKSSGVMIYDHAARRAVLKMQAPACMRGKKIMVQF